MTSVHPLDLQQKVFNYSLSHTYLLLNYNFYVLSMYQLHTRKFILYTQINKPNSQMSQLLLNCSTVSSNPSTMHAHILLILTLIVVLVTLAIPLVDSQFSNLIILGFLTLLSANEELTQACSLRV